MPELTTAFALSASYNCASSVSRARKSYKGNSVAISEGSCNDWWLILYWRSKEFKKPPCTACVCFAFSWFLIMRACVSFTSCMTLKIFSNMTITGSARRPGKM